MYKKGFILYHDTCEVFSELSDEQAGQLIKEIIKDARNISENNPVGSSGLKGLMKVIKKQFTLQLQRDWEKYKKKVEVAISNGKRGGRPKEKTNPVFIGTENNRKKPVKDKDKDKDIYINDFQEFWDTFGDKRGVAAARKAYIKARQAGAEHTDILRGAEKYKTARGTDRKYWKQAQGWLNDNRWLDEHEPVAKQTFEERKKQAEIFGA